MALSTCPVFRKLKWHSYPGGAYAPISRARAVRITAKVSAKYGQAGLPRPGYRLTICRGMWLANKAGKFELDRAWEGFRRRR
jgi:hypothetical protein